MGDLDASRDDELSVVDLLAVLLRWRAVIIGMLALALAAAAVAVAVLPGMLYRSAIERRQVEALGVVDLSPAARALTEGSVIAKTLTPMFTDPVLLRDALSAAGIDQVAGTELGTQGASAALAQVRALLVEGRTLGGRNIRAEERPFSFSAERGDNRLSFRASDGDKAVAFIRSAVALANDRLSLILRLAAQAEVEHYEELQKKEGTNPAISEAQALAYPKYAAAVRFLAGAEGAFGLVQEPYVLEPVLSVALFRSQVIKFAALMVVAALFLALLSAFALEGMRRVRSDPEAMAKLSVALREGRRSRR